jgi:hypothetical protein
VQKRKSWARRKKYYEQRSMVMKWLALLSPPPSSPTEYIEREEKVYSEVDKISAVEIARVHKRREKKKKIKK